MQRRLGRSMARPVWSSSRGDILWRSCANATDSNRATNTTSIPRTVPPYGKNSHGPTMHGFFQYSTSSRERAKSWTERK